jgi:hypothetical protein
MVRHTGKQSLSWLLCNSPKASNAELRKRMISLDSLFTIVPCTLSQIIGTERVPVAGRGQVSRSKIQGVGTGLDVSGLWVVNSVVHLTCYRHRMHLMCCRFRMHLMCNRHRMHLACYGHRMHLSYYVINALCTLCVIDKGPFPYASNCWKDGLLNITYHLHGKKRHLGLS